MLEGEIVFYDVQLFFEGDSLELLGLHAAAEDIAQLGDGGAGAGRVLVDEGADAIESVEDEMGVDMGLDGLQLQLLHKGFELEGIELLFGADLDIMKQIVD